MGYHLGFRAVTARSPSCSQALAQQAEGTQVWAYGRASSSISFYLFTQAAALPPPFLGGLEFTSQSPGWHSCCSRPNLQWRCFPGNCWHPFTYPDFKWKPSFSSLPSWAVQGLSKGYRIAQSTSPLKKGWGSSTCSALEKEGSGRPHCSFPVLKGSL